MSKRNKIDQETLKNLNRQIILNLIRKNREISRIDLAGLTKLSPTTVSTIISDLAVKRLVTEIGIGESSGGRKPMMIGINPNARYAAGIVLDHKGAWFSVVNMNYETLYREDIRQDIQGAEQVRNILTEGTDRLLTKCAELKKDICGFGISIPGVIEHRKGQILYSSKMHLQDFNVSQLFSEKFNARSYVYKDTDALILGEYNAGIGRGFSNFIYIHIEDGVGMSYINNGKLLYPGYGGGFELGHITIDSNGPLCRCGNRGCLGAVVADQPIISRLESLYAKGYETFAGDVKKLTLGDIVALSNNGDKACRYVLEEQARVLGTAAASVINLLNPQLIAVGGPLGECTWNFLDILKDTVRDRALGIFSRNTEIKFAGLGDESAIIGMANEVFDMEVFNPVELRIDGVNGLMEKAAAEVIL